MSGCYTLLKLERRKMECKSCWWQEGGKCYVDENNTVPVPLSKCAGYVSKRAALSSVIPTDKLIITSERAANLKVGERVTSGHTPESK
jgi:hypothetical protein